MIGSDRPETVEALFAEVTPLIITTPPRCHGCVAWLAVVAWVSVATLAPGKAGFGKTKHGAWLSIFSRAHSVSFCA